VVENARHENNELLNLPPLQSRELHAARLVIKANTKDVIFGCPEGVLLTDLTEEVAMIFQWRRIKFWRIWENIHHPLHSPLPQSPIWPVLGRGQGLCYPATQCYSDVDTRVLPPALALPSLGVILGSSTHLHPDIVPENLPCHPSLRALEEFGFYAWGDAKSLTSHKQERAMV
jgi:hypothetical protein